LDSAAGGSGQRLDITSVRQSLEADDSLRIILAGGLNAENVQAILQLAESSRQVVAVDVSSGIESEGSQSLDKIKAFIAAAKTSRFG
jgi:anthranilate synthase/indole-3-glycerol phosphate synthase/phosphoribosylanthranilate isomerase